MNEKRIANLVLIDCTRRNRKESLSALRLFLNDADEEQLVSSYLESGDDKLELKNDADRSALGDILLIPECAVYQIQNSPQGADGKL